MKAKARQKRQEQDLTGIAARRIGGTPREQLAWLVSLIESRAPETPEDWGNLRRELLVFAKHAAGAPSFGLAHTERDERPLLDDIAEMLGHAIRRETIALPSQPRELAWFPTAGRYCEHVSFQRDTFRNAVLRGLASRLVECGHLLKECPAPAKRGKAGEICETRFVAKRPNQAYCSATCQSRASTRAAREGTETAATVTQRKEKEGKS